MLGIRSSALRRATAALLAGGLLFSLAACTNDPLADQYRAGDNKGFISGDGAVQEIPADQRGEPVEFAATTENGDPVASEDYLGGVLVVNFWYAACGPCRAEAADLEKAYGEFAGQDVEFLGVNTIDSAAAAAAFAETYGITYPSAIAARRRRSSSRSPRRRRSRPRRRRSCSMPRAGSRRASSVSCRTASILTTLVRETLEESS